MNVEQINELHSKAMRMADLAFLAQKQGNKKQFQEYSRQAYLLEAQAARLLENTDIEPTRSVLYRSAATLALDCGEIREAEKLVATALIGNPPTQVVEELRDLMERIHFERHLSLRGIILDASQLQMSISGRAVSYGMALTEVVISRVNTMEKLIHRTVERLSNKPYRETGGVTKVIRDKYSLYMSQPRSGSFSLTFKVGRLDQPQLDVFDNSDEIIDELLNCVRLLNNSEENELRSRIPDPAYYRNFVALSKRIAPDGTDVSMLGLTTLRQNQEVGVSFTRQSEEIPTAPKIEEINSEQIEFGDRITVIGTLKYADALKRVVVKR